MTIPHSAPQSGSGGSVQLSAGRELVNTDTAGWF